MKTKKKFQSKAAMRKAIRLMEEADKAVESIREHFDCEWGEGSHSQLDVALSVGVLRKLDEARAELSELLTKFKGRAVRTSFPTGRKRAKPAVTVADLQKAMVC